MSSFVADFQLNLFICCGSNLIGCENELAQIHTRHPHACNKVGGVIIMQIKELKRFALLWLHKTEQVRADMAHWSKNITGDIYEAGWISQMYGYSFAAAEVCSLFVDYEEIFKSFSRCRTLKMEDYKIAKLIIIASQ